MTWSAESWWNACEFCDNATRYYDRRKALLAGIRIPRNRLIQVVHGIRKPAHTERAVYFRSHDSFHGSLRAPFRRLPVLHVSMAVAIGLLSSLVAQLGAQTSTPQTTAAQTTANPPLMDNKVFTHVLFDQLDGRTDGPDNEFRWDGQPVGTDMNKLWLKSEGFMNAGKMRDGDHEGLYDRPIPRMQYFDAQAGIRADLDSGPKRVWGAGGIEGLVPHIFSSNRHFTSLMEVTWRPGRRAPMICCLRSG